MSKILLISHIFPPAIDGGSRVIYKIGQYFETQNHQTLYLSSNCSSTDDFTKSKYKKIPTIYHLKSKIYLPVYHHLRRPLKFINLFLPKNSYLYNLLKVLQKGPIFKIIPFIKTIAKIIKFKPDLIIAGPLPTTIILYANFFKKLSKICQLSSKILINTSFHQTDQDFFQKPLIKTLQQADYLWTLTQYETDFFIKKLNINPQKIILAGNGIDKNFLVKKSKKKKSNIQHLRSNILFIGSLSAHKGVDTLINSFSEIYHLRPNISLIIAGQKTLYYPQIKNIVDQQPKSVQEKIKFIFNFPQKKLKQLIDNCDVLVLPSKQESFGLVIIEAWARQKPVIVSDIPPLQEIVKKTSGGLVFQTENSKDLQQKILKLIKSPKTCQLLGQNGYNYVKNNYTWPIVGKKIQQNISSLPQSSHSSLF
ncbi:MAG: glycosyltransferase family 4 protein [Candidatus Shapirobacteria bacterium]|nr:glycosyltransferase family 4 protein [Candidatus Shapirobacteria bacterium]